MWIQNRPFDAYMAISIPMSIFWFKVVTNFENFNCFVLRNKSRKWKWSFWFKSHSLIKVLILVALHCSMREGGVLKVPALCMFPLRRTNGTFAAPPRGVLYRAEQMFRWIWIQHPACYQTAEKCFSRFSSFTVTVDQAWEQTQKRHFVGFARNFLSPALLPLEMAEGVPIDPLLV